MKLNPPVFAMKTGGFWSGLRDLNPRSLEPKSSAIPNFAKPGYKVEDVSDVVKHVVKSHFRPQVLKSQGKSARAATVFRIADFSGKIGSLSTQIKRPTNWATPGNID